MLRRSIFAGFIIVLVALTGWDLAWWCLGVRPIFPWTLKRGLNDDPSQYILVDVRPQREYERSHIRGANHRPILLTEPKMLGHQSAESAVVVICTSGHLSTRVVYKLNKLGYKNIYNLTGGMLGWYLVNGPIVANKLN